MTTKIPDNEDAPTGRKMIAMLTTPPEPPSPWPKT